MNYLFFIMFFFFLMPATVFSQDEEKEEPEFRIKQYFMVLLKRGPNKDLDSLALQEIQKGHMAHIKKMAEEKKLVLAGPFGDNTELRGIFVFDVPTLDEAVKLTEQDPAVKSGRLIMEIHPWYSEPGTCLP
jgi:uncharacterized protein